MSGRSPSPEKSIARGHALYAIIFVVDLVLAVLAIGALLDLRSRMVEAFGTSEKIDAL